MPASSSSSQTATSAAATGLRWGLIGASNIAATQMIPAMRAQPGSRVVAVSSGNVEHAKRFAQEHGIEHVCSDYQQLLARADVDAVYISSTNELHLPQTLAAARAGKHVLCEKPLALSVADAEQMVRACQEAGVLMATNHHLRNAAVHRRLRALVEQGAIGQVLFARVFHAVYLPPVLQGWRIQKPQAGGGVVLDIVVHDADTLRFVLQAEPHEVTALTCNSGMAQGALEDGSMAVLRFDNGVLAQIHEAFSTRYAGTGLELHGTLGSLVARDCMTARPTPELRLRTEQGEQVIAIEHEDLYVRGVRLFEAAVRGAGQPAATGADGVASLTVALAVLQSARTGQVVKLGAGQGA